MTQLQDITDIADLEICSLEEVANNSGQPKVYKRWFGVQERLKQEGKAPSLSAYLLYQHQFNDIIPGEFDVEFGFPLSTTKRLMKKMGIPMRNNSEAKKIEAQKALTKDLIDLIEILKEEVDAHKQGKINRLTTNQEIFELLDIDRLTTVFKLLPESYKSYRIKAIRSQAHTRLGNSDREAFLDLVKEEIDLHRQKPEGKLSTAEDLMELSGWARFTVLNCLGKLSKKDRDYRKESYYETRFHKVRPEDKRALIELVKEEISLYESGKIDRFTENGDLAEVLGISRGMMGKYLVRYLTKEKRRKRAGVIKSYHAKQRIEAIGEEEMLRRCSKAGKRNYELHGNPAKVISAEEKKEIGKRVYRKYGPPLLMLTPKQRHEMAVQRIKDFGNPFDKVPQEVLARIRKENGLKYGRRNGIRVAEMIRKNSYNIEGRFCCQSQQEGAVALLLERYIPNYQVREGESFQVSEGIDNGGIDFLINGEFLEWHPIILAGVQSRRGDIPREDYKSYQRLKHTLPEDERRQFQQDYKTHLALHYRNTRQQAVNNSRYSGARVSLVTTERELYDFISRFSATLPPFGDFKREFSQKLQYVKGFKFERGNGNQKTSPNQKP